MIYLLALFLLLAGILAISSNSDIFSPAKFLLFFFLMFHVGAVAKTPSNAVLGLMFITVVIGLFSTFVEAVRVQYLPPPTPPARPAFQPVVGSAVFFWLISIPSLYAQYYMIDQLGGIEAYIRSVGLRVVEWSGYGAARTIINLMTTLNVAYFAVGLTKKRSLNWWLAWSGHFLIVLSFGFLSGSRSGLLNVIALLVVIFHYMRRPIGPGFALGIASVLVLFASILGVARKGFRLTDGELTTGLSSTGESFSFNSFYYGIDPLTLLTSVYPMPLAHGSTFLSLFTNAIPREIYPEKPDTGGVFLTKNYAGDQWEGYSNLTPTFIGEWAMNFGWIAGLIGYVVSMSVIMLLLISLYRRVARHPQRVLTAEFAINLTIYVHLVWTVMALLVGEVTNVVLGFVLTQLIPLLGVRTYLAWRARMAKPPGATASPVVEPAVGGQAR